MKAQVNRQADTPFQDLGGGVCRRVRAYTEQLMTVEVRFETGSTGSVHTHPHAQNTFVLEGRFRFDIDGEAVEVGPGDTLAIHGGIPHGTLCLEKGALLDIFTPMRGDFL